MYGICTLRTFYFFSKNRLTKILFSNPFPYKRSDGDSQQSGFGFDLNNPPRVWVLKIHILFFGFWNPDLDSPKKGTLYVDGRCDPHPQFPRSPLGTPGTVNPPGFTTKYEKKRMACIFRLSLLRKHESIKRLAFLDSRSYGSASN